MMLNAVQCTATGLYQRVVWGSDLTRFELQLLMNLAPGKSAQYFASSRHDCDLSRRLFDTV